jgi:hypothetical protein
MKVYGTTAEAEEVLLVEREERRKRQAIEAAALDNIMDGYC